MHSTHVRITLIKVYNYVFMESTRDHRAWKTHNKSQAKKYPFNQSLKMHEEKL